ncbi:MAG TPA: ABC transporter permease [Trebonia sp.]|jgi:simple sugar transport system permease protein|nr:ABC transporter permease [Trebonia sp.]
MTYRLEGRRPQTHAASQPTASAMLAARSRRRALALTAGLGVILVLLAVNAGGEQVTLDLGSGLTHGPDATGPVWVFCGVTALVCLAATALIAVTPGAERLPRRVSAAVVVALLAFVFGLLAWAARTTHVSVGGVLDVTVGSSIAIMLGSTSGVLSEQSGVFNIAIEAEFLAGAFTAAIVGSATQSTLIGLVAGIAAGLFTGWLLAVLTIRYHVDQVVAGIVLVTLVDGLTSYLTEQILSPEANTLNSPPVIGSVGIPLLDKIPVVGEALFDQSPLFYLAIVVVIAVEFLLRKTRTGLRIRAAGESPEAAESSGLNVRRLRYLAVCTAGAIAGAGGAYFTVGSSGSFVAEISSGLGYVALAAVILGGWRPTQAAAAALLFGFASSISTSFSLLKVNVPPSLLLMIPYVVTIVVVCGMNTAGRAPAAAGGRLDN